MCDLPGPGLEPVSPALAGGFFSFFFLYSRFFLVIHFVHISVYMSIPTAQFITPPPPPLGRQILNHCATREVPNPTFRAEQYLPSAVSGASNSSSSQGVVRMNWPSSLLQQFLAIVLSLPWLYPLSFKIWLKSLQSLLPWSSQVYIFYYYFLSVRL